MVKAGRGDETDAILAGLPAGERRAIIAALVPLYIAGIHDGETDGRRRARDALFSLRTIAPDQREHIDGRLLPLLERDLRAGRLNLEGGRHSLREIVTAIGVPAVPMLSRLLVDTVDSYDTVAALLLAVGDERAREEAGVLLAKRAARQSPLSLAMWRSLAKYPGRATSEFLMHKLTAGKGFEPALAAGALQQHHEPAVRALAVKLAVRQRIDKGIRLQMLTMAAAIGGGDARPLVRLIALDGDWEIRWRAFAAAIRAGGAGVIRPALEAFPARARYRKEDIADRLVRPLANMGEAARPGLVSTLRSRSSLARLVALLALVRTGGNQHEAVSAQRLVDDQGTVRGFPPGDTVGKTAAWVSGSIAAGARLTN